MANEFRSGTAGDVYVESNLIAGIASWGLDQTTAPVPIPNFQSSVDADGRVWPNVLAGLSGATGSLQGYFDVDATNYTDGPVTQIATGIFVTLILLESKAEPWGYGVNVLITSFNNTVNINNQPNSFTANFIVNGVVPISSIQSP